MATTAIQAALESAESTEADIVAFTGAGEPTLASNLSDAIDLTRSLLDLPVAVLTNSSLLPRDDVKRDLAKADIVIAKLDAPDEDVYQAVNRPFVTYKLAAIVGALREFRIGFRGKLVVQMSIVDENKPHLAKMASMAGDLLPDEIQVNLRAPWWTACSASADLESVCCAASGVVTTGMHGDSPTWDQIVAAGELHQSGRCNAEVMLAVMLDHVGGQRASPDSNSMRKIRW